MCREINLILRNLEELSVPLIYPCKTIVNVQTEIRTVANIAPMDIYQLLLELIEKEALRKNSS